MNRNHVIYTTTQTCLKIRNPGNAYTQCLLSRAEYIHQPCNSLLSYTLSFVRYKCSARKKVLFGKFILDY